MPVCVIINGARNDQFCIAMFQQAGNGMEILLGVHYAERE